ncbi:MAG: TonB-dependent receptor, partial [Novosphingobium sp.]|nr:TonB-dependent receptor [Novosphingobium sp.]
MITIRKAALAAATMLGTCHALPAFAQDAADATADSNTIIVTAQRRSEALEDVPMTVSVVSQETLNSLGVNTVRDLQNVTSGFMVNNSGSYPQPAIRGITTINAGSYENNVALFVDGLYQYTAQVLNMDLPNVQNIQVLKGPQGTLYGRNATGGAILIDTIDPTDTWHGNVEGTYANYNDRRARGYVAGPLSDRIGFSIAGTYRKTDGYYKKASRTTPGTFEKDHFLGLDQQSILAKLKFDLTDSFRATLGYSYIRASDPRGVFFTGIENVNVPYTGANATKPRNLGEVAGDIWDLDLHQHEASLKLEWDTGIGTLRSVTGYTKEHLDTTYDSDGSYAAGSYSDSRIWDTVWQENLDFTIKAIDRLDLIVGGNYYNINTRYAPDRANANFSAPAGSPPGTPLSSYLKTQEIFFWRTKEAWAGFIDATFHATDKLSINVGGRYSEETQDVAAEKNFYCTTPAGCMVGSILIPVGGITSTPYTRAGSAQGSKYSKFTPRASIRYEIGPRTNIYASYSQGFRAGEWNSVPPVDTDMSLWKSNGQIGQETVDAFEVGVKAAGRRFHADLAGFYYNYHDLQVSTSVFINGLTVVSLQAVPRAKIYGIEGNFDFEVVDNFKLRAGATWLHARYGDGAVFVGTSVNPALAGYNSNPDPLRTLPNASSTAMDISGMQMARAPDFSGYIGFDYLIPKGDGGFRFAANLKYTTSYVVTNLSIWGGEPLGNATTGYTGRVNAARAAGQPIPMPDNSVKLAGTPYADRSNEQRARQGAYALLNASVTWSDPTDHYYVRLWGNNLTN